MFSFQYPNPKTNFPFYHSEDPDIFLDRSHEPVDYTDDDDYIHAVPPDYDDDDEECIQTVINQPFRFTTIETDKKFISKRLTQKSIVKNETPTLIPSPDPVTTSDIDIRPTNPWAFSTPVQTATGFSDIIQEQKTKEEDDRRKAVELASRRFARPRVGACSSEHAPNPSPTPGPNHVPSEKTRLCIYGKDCKNKKKCMRSHSFQEWQPNVCRFNKKCRNNKCLYYHEGDDKNAYLSNIINCNKDQMAFYSKNKTMYMKNYMA